MILRVIQAVILGLGAVQGTLLTKNFVKNREKYVPAKTIGLYWGAGLVLNFFDYLGIGAMAPTMALYRLTHSVKDEEIPGTLVTGCVVPVAVEALASLSIIKVEIPTLITMYVMGIAGAFLGGKFTSRMKANTIRKFMGFALLVAAVLMLLSKFGLMPLGGTARGLHGIKFVIGGIGAFVFGVLLTVGIGNYAPTMVLVYLLGMNPAVSFPLMMGVGCLGVAGGSFPFFESGKFNKQASFGFAIAGIPGVIAAAFIVKSMPIGVLQWLVIVVCVYTGIATLRQAFREDKRGKKIETIPEEIKVEERNA